MEELNRFEKINVCFAIADSINKEDSRIGRIRKKIEAGEKRFYVVGLGSEDINKVRDRAHKTIEALNSASRKLECP